MSLPCRAGKHVALENPAALSSHTCGTCTTAALTSSTSSRGSTAILSRRKPASHCSTCGLTDTDNNHMMTLPRAERTSYSPGADRGKERARFYSGIAAAMAQQWGDHVLHSAASAERAAA
ncbi:hypothetical protein AB5I41_01625 [Sphingomonas sp. MMS24-JH45]